MRDWGHAKDYVEMQWLMLQQDTPEDFVIATGRQYSVRDFVNAAAGELGMKIRWEGEGVSETGILYSAHEPRITSHQLPVTDQSPVTSHQSPVTSHVPRTTGNVIVRVDPRYFRPTEVETLLGDPSKAKQKLGWEPRITFEELVQEMVREDLRIAERDALVNKHGYRVMAYHE